MSLYDVFTSPLNPSSRIDHRIAERCAQDSGLDRSISNVAYRLINSVDRLLSKRTH